MSDGGVWPTIAGALIAVIAGACGSIYTDISRDRAERQKERTRIRSVLFALHAELNVVWEHYTTEIGPTIANIEVGQGLYMTYPIYHNYFMVFDSHVDAIGALNNSELSRDLVRGFVLSKGMVDNLRFNNSLIKKLEDADPRAADNSLAVNLRHELREAYREELNSYGPVLQTAHARLTTIIPPLLEAIKVAANAIAIEASADSPLHTLYGSKLISFSKMLLASAWQVAMAYIKKAITWFAALARK